LRKLQDVYGAQGLHPSPDQTGIRQDLAQGIVDIDFKIDEGEVVYVGPCCRGRQNTHTKEYVIRREILLKEGEPFSSVKARKSVERLYNLGFLDNVDVDVQQPASPTKADVIYTVTEGKPGMLSAGAGFSSVDGLIGTLQVQHTNFLGRGQRVNLQWQFGGRVNSFDIGWTEPGSWANRSRSASTSFKTQRVQQFGTDLDAYKTHNTGASVTAGPRFSDVYNLLFTYSYADTTRDDLSSGLSPADRALILGPEAATNPAITEFHAIKSNLTEQLIRDTRDNQFDPSAENRTSIALTEGGLGPHTIQFFRPVIDHSIHIPTFWKFVLSIHGQWGLVKPYGDSDLTDIVDELFRVGGSDTVRGYELGQVGVLNGGQVANIYNVEYKFPIAPDEHGPHITSGCFLLRYRRIMGFIERCQLQNKRRPIGAQTGRRFWNRFKTPVFPLRLDWGYALNRSPNQEPSQFYFTVGSLF
jgi:outer membrane protein insertion porin family